MPTSRRRSARRVQHWWLNRSPRQRAFLTWFFPLAFAHVFIAVAYWFNVTHGQSLARDAWTLRIAGIVEALSVVVMLAGARRWDAVSLGLTLFFCANSPVLTRVFGHLGPPVDIYGVEGNLIRSYYQVGSPILFLGLIAWMFGRRFGLQRTALTPTLEEHERAMERLRLDLADARSERDRCQGELFVLKGQA